MARVTLTIEDHTDEATGAPYVSLVVESDPPFSLDDSVPNTPAQEEMIVLVQQLHEQIKSENRVKSITVTSSEGETEDVQV